MSTVLAEVMPEVKSLSRADKLRLIQLVAEELALVEQAGIEADQSYPVWSPESAFSAADAMLHVLSRDKARS